MRLRREEPVALTQRYHEGRVKRLGDGLVSQRKLFNRVGLHGFGAAVTGNAAKRVGAVEGRKKKANSGGQNSAGEHLTASHSYFIIVIG